MRCSVVALGVVLVASWTSPSAADEDWERDRAGARFMLGGGAEMLLFGFLPSGGAGYLETALNVGLAPAVDFRLTGLFAFGGGVSSDPYLLVLPALRTAFRFNFGSVYTMWIGFSGRAGVGIPLDGRDEAGLVPLYGPDLSLTSFRFGDRGQYEFDLDGGAFLPPIHGARWGLTARYLF